MTRQQRTLHAKLWPILAIGVALLFAAALIAREWRGG